jgi:NAD(P)-dependent dehydrogenase (short-subunit alcohol dehydrogenase family)
VAGALADAGADVIIASRDLTSCRDAADEIAAATGRRTFAHACHVGHWDELEQLAEAAWGWTGRLDVLVNNAGMSPVYDDVARVTEELFDKVVGVNLKGPFRLTALIGSRMVEQGGGSIVNVSSVGGVRPQPDTIPDSAVKAGLNAMTVAFAHLFGPAVRVNAVAPGGFLTNVSKHWDPDRLVAANAATALRRVVTYYAIGRLGAVYREHEVRDAAERTRAKVIIVPDTFRRFDHAAMARSIPESVDAVRHVIVVGAATDSAVAFAELLTAPRYDGPLPSADDLHIVLFTSGTTAKPKGTQHSFNTLLACARTFRTHLRVTSSDRCFMPSPIMHNTGLNSGVLLPTLTGGGIVLQDIWEADAAMRMIGEYRCTMSVGATPFVTMMLDEYDPARHDLSSLSVFVCGGAPVPATVVRDRHRDSAFN